MHEIALLLEAKDVPASNGATFDRLNPVTGDVASRAAAAQIADARRAADAATCLARIGYDEAARTMACQARLIGALQHPLVVGDDTAAARVHASAERAC